ncbi:uncharacterized protein B0H18DRAFT_1114164 [Fomitopsis serialis]|uniref:uncharacterized protein n=1 Tax=Fomitopsis serialis TaxID=139415 RepID=UPI0020072BCE|nr:uncharacterized protein B0H18DRAFT_1114164 [Neoantrodia serialis]KAH9935411.1 hypothetical protein B0H18DRAFT_1114164 [Neoantrodia serialis]
MGRGSSWEMYMGNASSMTQVPTGTSDSSLRSLDDLFLEVFRLTARAFERVDEPAGDRLARIKATQFSDAVPSDTTVGRANSEQATAHQYDRSEGVAVASRGRHEQPARRTSLHQFSVYERVVTEDRRATSRVGACQVNVNLRTLERSGYESRSERSTGRAWSPASNQASEHGTRGAGPTTVTSVEYEDLCTQDRHARGSGQRTSWAKVKAVTRTYTTDYREYQVHRHGAEREEVGKLLAVPKRVFVVGDEDQRPEERTGMETRASEQVQGMTAEVGLTGGSDTASDACLAVVAETTLTYGISSTDYAYPGPLPPSARPALCAQEHATSAFEFGVDDAPLLDTQRGGDGHDGGTERVDLARVQQGRIVAMSEMEYNESSSENHEQPQAESAERGRWRGTIAQAPEPRSAQSTGASLVAQVEDLARAFSPLPRLCNTSSSFACSSTWRSARCPAVAHTGQAARTEGTTQGTYERQCHAQSSLPGAYIRCRQFSGAQDASVSASERTGEWERFEGERGVRRTGQWASESPEQSRLNECDAAGLGIDVHAPPRQQADPAIANSLPEGTLTHGPVPRQELMRQASWFRNSQSEYYPDSSSPRSQVMLSQCMVSERATGGSRKDSVESLATDTEWTGFEHGALRRKQDELKKTARRSIAGRDGPSEGRKQNAEGAPTFGRVSTEAGITDKAPTTSRSLAGPLFSQTWAIALARKETVHVGEASVGRTSIPERSKEEEEGSCRPQASEAEEGQYDAELGPALDTMGHIEDTHTGIQARVTRRAGGKSIYYEATYDRRTSRTITPTGESRHACSEVTASQHVLSLQAGHEYGSENMESQAVADTARASSEMEVRRRKQQEQDGPLDASRRQVADSDGQRELWEERMEEMQTSGCRSTLEIAWRCAKQLAGSGDHVAEGTAGEPRYRERADNDSSAGRREHEKVGGLVVAMRRVSRRAGRRDVQPQDPDEAHTHGQLARAREENGLASRFLTVNGSMCMYELQGAKDKTADSKRAEVRDVDGSQSEEAELGERASRVTIVQLHGPGPVLFTPGVLVSRAAEGVHAISRCLRSIRTPDLSSSLAYNTVWRHTLQEATGGSPAIGQGGCCTREPVQFRGNKERTETTKCWGKWYKRSGMNHGRTEAGEGRNLLRVKAHGSLDDAEERVRTIEVQWTERATRARKMGRRASAAVETCAKVEESPRTHSITPECSKAGYSTRPQVRPGKLLRSDEGRSGNEPLVETQASKKGRGRCRIVTDTCVGSQPNNHTREDPTARDGSPGNEPSESDDRRLRLDVPETANGCGLGECRPQEVSGEGVSSEARGGRREVRGPGPGSEQAEFEREGCVCQDRSPGASPERGRTGETGSEDTKATCDEYVQTEHKGMGEWMQDSDHEVKPLQVNTGMVEVSKPTSALVDVPDVAREGSVADRPARGRRGTDQAVSLKAKSGEAKVVDEHAERCEVARSWGGVRALAGMSWEDGRAELGRTGESHAEDSECEGVSPVNRVEISQSHRLKADLADVHARRETDQAASFRAAESQGSTEASARTSGESGRVASECEREGECTQDGDSATVLQVNSYGISNLDGGLVGSPDIPRRRHVTVARDVAQATAESDGQEPGPHAGFVEVSQPNGLPGDMTDQPSRREMGEGHVRAHGDANQLSSGEPESADECAGHGGVREATRPWSRAAMSTRIGTSGGNGHTECKGASTRAQDSNSEAVLQVNLLEMSEPTELWADVKDMPLRRGAGERYVHAGGETSQGQSSRPSTREMKDGGAGKIRCGTKWQGLEASAGTSSGMRRGYGCTRRGETGTYTEEGGGEAVWQVGIIETSWSTNTFKDVLDILWQRSLAGDLSWKRRDDERHGHEVTSKYEQDGKCEEVLQMGFVEISQQNGCFADSADIPGQRYHTGGLVHTESEANQRPSIKPSMGERADEHTGRDETWRASSAQKHTTRSESEWTSSQENGRFTESGNVPWQGRTTGGLGYKQGSETKEDRCFDSSMVDCDEDIRQPATQWSRNHDNGPDQRDTTQGHGERPAGMHEEQWDAERGCGEQAISMHDEQREVLTSQSSYAHDSTGCREVSGTIVSPVEPPQGLQTEGDVEVPSVRMNSYEPESASQDTPEDAWLLGDFGEFDTDTLEQTSEDDLVACWHIAKDGRRLWGYIPRAEAEAALREVEQADKWIPEDDTRTVDEDTERSKWLAQYLVHECVRLGVDVSDNPRSEDSTQCETGQAGRPGNPNAHGPAERERPQSADPSMGSLVVSRTGWSKRENVDCKMHDDGLVSCCHLDDHGQWIIEFLPRDESKRAVTEADQQLRGGFMRSLVATRGHTADNIDRNNRQYQAHKQARDDTMASGNATVADDHRLGLAGECLLVECAELRVPEEVCDEKLVSCWHLDENGHRIVEYLPCADTERAMVKTNQDCGWLDEDDGCTHGVSGVWGHDIEDGEASGLATFMSQWIALG